MISRTLVRLVPIDDPKVEGGELPEEKVGDACRFA